MCRSTEWSLIRSREPWTWRWWRAGTERSRSRGWRDAGRAPIEIRAGTWDAARAADRAMELGLFLVFLEKIALFLDYFFFFLDEI